MMWGNEQQKIYLLRDCTTCVPTGHKNQCVHIRTLKKVAPDVRIHSNGHTIMHKNFLNFLITKCEGRKRFFKTKFTPTAPRAVPEHTLTCKSHNDSK